MTRQPLPQFRRLRIFVHQLQPFARLVILQLQPFALTFVRLVTSQLLASHLLELQP
ncbi:hypothetical protein [Deinococcus sp. 23YEL01]|uniref:hypothetical protein n=1 Tax=Deinococcus sp. 23YEL01 TaxID=2745871 RepID=UPI001E2B639C|nr:hypothetical protein [Deinococcus sp. 23YEL01]MCD0168641.1 hypothetical protein [Deinococcus sp. 23YEL01]